MEIDDVIKENRGEILRIARKHGVSRMRLFGSVVRGEAEPDSDVDFLIDVDGPTTPWFPGGLVANLESLLGRSVDVVETGSIREEMKERILEEAVPL
ncbi:MAG: DNA polymerase subunit beta [bacterium]|nr:MAG: DNA polymerase subunit beta [bacterium]